MDEHVPAAPERRDETFPGGSRREPGDADFAPGHPAHYAMTPEKHYRKENRRLKTTLAVVSAVLFAAILLIFMLVFSLAGSGLALPADGMMRTVVREGDRGVRVAVIPVRGLMIAGEEGGVLGSGTAGWVVRALEAASKDPGVKAIILSVDSRGGSITAADLIHHKVEEVRRGIDGRKGVKVVALLKGVAASGGYYVAAPADSIVAYPTALTGSIGTIMQTVNVEGLLEHIGVQSVVIKSGKYKDMGSPFRSPTDEERAILQSVADEAYQRFVSVIVRGRRMPVDEVTKLADGRIFTATQALEAGLVDSLGYFDEAVAEAEKLAEVTNATVVRYGRMPSLMDFLTMESKTGDPAVRLARLLSGVGPMYLAEDLPAGGYIWRPGMTGAGR